MVETMSQDRGQKYLSNGINFTDTVHHDTYPAIDPTKADLSGKYIFITGASKGVGKAAAISYAQAGASGIALGARSSLDSVVDSVKAAAKKVGHPEPKILALKLDVTELKSVQDAAQQVSDAFEGKVDILINNAGLLTGFTSIGEKDPEEWWREWEVNVKGVYFTTHTFLPLLLSSTLKTIINMSSIGAHLPTPGASSYCCAKLVMLRLSEFINVDHAQNGILAYSYHPGGVKTELALNMPDVFHDFLVDEPELSADMLVWLTKERRMWLAGRYVSANWDVEELEGRRGEIERGDLLKVRMAVNSFPERG